MNSIESLLRFIAQYININNNLRERLYSIAKESKYITGNIIITEGQFNRHFRYLYSGSVRFYANYDGRDITTWIELEDQLLCSYDGFSFKRKGEESIEVLEDTIIVYISADDFVSLLNDYPEMEHFIRLWLEEIFAIQLEFYRFLMFMSAKEKYQRLLTYIPDIDLRVKAIHIASLLGITPETLSRLRAERLK